MDDRDLNALLGAVLFHLLLAIGLIQLARYEKHRPAPRVIEFEVHRPPPPPPPPVARKEEPPPPPPPPPKRVHVKAPPVATAPPPNVTPPPKAEPPKEPPKVFAGVSFQSTTEGDSSFSVPVGNTTIGDPGKNRGKPQPLPSMAPGVAPAPIFKPVSALEVKTEPDPDPACANLPYPDGEAKESGIEGQTLLRVEIDEKGKVHGVRVLRGVGHGLDEYAIRAIRYQCHFKPARNTSDQPVPFVITYTFQWQIDR